MKKTFNYLQNLSHSALVDLAMRFIDDPLKTADELTLAVDASDRAKGPVISVKCAAGIVMVLGLDDADTCASMGLEVDYNRSRCTITGRRADLESLARECNYRRDMTAWDQPLSWARSAKAAEKKIRAALKEAKE